MAPPPPHVASVLALRDHLAQNGPPPNVRPNYINPPNNGNACIIASLLTLVVAFILVTARVFTKAHVLGSYGWDDYTAILALAFAIARTACIVSAIKIWGFGRHIWDVPSEWNVMLWRLKAIADTLYPPSMACAKISIILFYLNMFRIAKPFRLACWALMAFIVLYLTPVFLVYMFYCKPLVATWNYTLPGECIDGWDLDLTNGALNIFTDAALLVLPLPMLWRLQLSTHRKVAVSAVFGVGIFAMAASITREVVIGTVLTRTLYDETWLTVDESMWLTIEMNVAIICGSLFFMPQFFRHFYERVHVRKSISDYWRSTSKKTSGEHLRSSRPKRRERFNKIFNGGSLELVPLSKTDTIVEGPRKNRDSDHLDPKGLDSGAIVQSTSFTVT